MEMFKANEESPPEPIVSAATSQHSTDSELHLEQSAKNDNKNNINSLGKTDITKASRSKQILNSNENSAQKKLKKSSRT